jgi:hypothetical protein
MRAGGVSVGKAKLMYYVVWRFGPRWSVSEIVPCIPNASIGKYCAESKPLAIEVSTERPYIDASDAPSAMQELRNVATEVETHNPSLDEIEKMADSKPSLPTTRTVTRKAGLTDLGYEKIEDYKTIEDTTARP